MAGDVTTEQHLTDSINDVVKVCENGVFTVWIVGVDDARLVLRDHRNRTIATFFEDHIEAIADAYGDLCEKQAAAHRARKGI